MIIRYFVAALLLLCLGVSLGSCSPFSGYVSDHWPHWAGGMPDGVPPRPGTPGYDQFIAHNQPGQSPYSPAVDETHAASGDKGPVIEQRPAVTAQKPVAAGEKPGDDPSTIQGGLY
jgi:hypothetical protein